MESRDFMGFLPLDSSNRIKQVFNSFFVHNMDPIFWLSRLIFMKKSKQASNKLTICIAEEATKVIKWAAHSWNEKCAG